MSSLTFRHHFYWGPINNLLFIGNSAGFYVWLQDVEREAWRQLGHLWPNLAQICGLIRGRLAVQSSGFLALKPCYCHRYKALSSWTFQAITQNSLWQSRVLFHPTWWRPQLSPPSFGYYVFLFSWSVVINFWENAILGSKSGCLDCLLMRCR